MTEQTMTPDHKFLKLVDAYCNNVLDAQSARQLTEILESDAASRRQFIEYVDLHNELYDHIRLEDYDLNVVLNRLDDDEAGMKRLHRRHMMLASLASCVLCSMLLVSVGYWYIQYAYYFGELLAIANGQLTFRDEPLTVNDRLGFGRLTLNDGAATIEIAGRTRFLMSAGSEVEILSRSSMRLTKGNISVQTGGRQIDILVGERKLTNLGTEFSVSLPEGRNSEVQVIQGALSVGNQEKSDSSMASSHISSGQGAAMGTRKGETIDSLPFNPCTFLSPTELVETIDKFESSRIAHSLREMKLNRAEGLVLRHSFEDVTLSSKLALNQAEGKLSFGEGKIIDATPTPGRHPHANAMHFRGGSFEDRIELTPEDSAHLDATRPMTVLMWVRAERFEHRFSRLISRGRGSELSWAIWFRRQDRVLGLGYGPTQPDNIVADVPIVDGKWHQIAFTFDPTVDGKTNISFYFDGELVNQTAAKTISTTAPLVIGSCQEGESWNGFTGDIDEVSIFNRVLPAEELQQLMQ
ncbi:LamG-like jellyroll fold domain-containing protein [Lacunimicrobium album]